MQQLSFSPAMNRREHNSTLPPLETAAKETVRLVALAANYETIRRRVAPAAVAPVVKADAYGLGIAPVARALAAGGADTFFVARLEEGIALRLLLPRTRIFVLDGIAKGMAQQFVF